MKTKPKPKVGDRVSFYFAAAQERIRGIVTGIDGEMCSIRADDGYNYRISMFNLRRLKKVPTKDKQRIAELEKENAELLQYKSYYDRAKGFLEGRNEVSALETLLKEHAEMKKVLGGETFWVGHDNKKMIESEFGSVPFTSRNDIQPICDYHTKVLVLETKAAGEV